MRTRDLECWSAVLFVITLALNVIFLLSVHQCIISKVRIIALSSSQVFKLGGNKWECWVHTWQEWGRWLCFRLKTSTLAQHNLQHSFGGAHKMHNSLSLWWELGHPTAQAAGWRADGSLAWTCIPKFLLNCSKYQFMYSFRLGTFSLPQSPPRKQ